MQVVETCVSPFYFCGGQPEVRPLGPESSTKGHHSSLRSYELNCGDNTVLAGGEGKGAGRAHKDPLTSRPEPSHIRSKLE